MYVCTYDSESGAPEGFVLSSCLATRGSAMPCHAAQFVLTFRPFEHDAYVCGCRSLFRRHRRSGFHETGQQNCQGQQNCKGQHCAIVVNSGCGCCGRCLCYFNSIAIRRPDRPTGPESMAPKLRKKVCQSAGRAQTVRSARVDPRTLTSPVGRMSAAQAAEQAVVAQLEPAEWEFDEYVPMWCSCVADTAEQASVARLHSAEWEFDDHVAMECRGGDHQGWALVAYIEHLMEEQLALNLSCQWERWS